MSRYSTSSIRLTSIALRRRSRLGGLVAETECLYGALAGIPTAQDLRGCTGALAGGRTLEAHDELAVLTSVAETVNGSSGSRAVLAVASGDRLARGESHLAEAREALERRDNTRAASALAEGRRE